MGSIIVTIVLIAVIFGLANKKRTKKSRSRRPRYTLEIREGDDGPRDKPHESVIAHWKYLAKYMPEELQKDGMFTAGYLGKLAASLLATGKTVFPEPDDILPGVAMKEAKARVQRRAYIGSMRSNAIRWINDMKSADAYKINVIFTRGTKPCGKVLQLGSYPPDSEIPIYPCADCLEDDVCIIDYRAEWKD